MGRQPEYERVERPLVEQLVAMGWTHLAGADPGHPAHDPIRSDRPSFGQTTYPGRFKAAVARINPDGEGQPWLSSAQLDHLYRQVTLPPGGLAANFRVTELLRTGVNARTLPGWRQGDPEHVRLVDWDQRFDDGNDLLAVSQFRVDRRDLPSVTPDLVLFVNGLPWVVVECKAFSRGRYHLDEGIDQLIRYAGASAEEPVADFVRFAQLLVVSNRELAELGTVTAEPANFAPWRTVEPADERLVREETGTPDRHSLSAQAVLVAGVLRPAHLLHLVRDFTTQSGTGAAAVKIFGRYPQFRAVKRLAARLAARRRVEASGEPPGHRGGIVWHTQGSGKSLTMAFLVRHLRNDPVLRGHKVVVVSDRLDLQKQIRGSLDAADENVHQAGGVDEARRYLAVDVADLVQVMIQKAQRDDSAGDETPESLGDGEGERPHIHNRVANDSAEIVVLIDEAHRSHTSWQHARLRKMLPNAVVVGFTGTPVLSGEQKATRDVFGDFADVYTLRDAERDGAVVPVRYEAHHVPLAVIEQAALDAGFDEEVPSDPERRERILERFSRRKEILESPDVIAAKAAHMVRHWALHALPDRFGAQVATVSRKAAVDYRAALLAARDGLVAEIDSLGSVVRHDPMAHDYLTAEQIELLTLMNHRDLLASVDAAVVIHGRDDGSDPAEWKRWTRKAWQDDCVERFKKGVGDVFAADAPGDASWPAHTHGRSALGHGTGWGSAVGEPWHDDAEPAVSVNARPDSHGREDEAAAEPLAFLVVQSKLLTGFDAPVEQVLYLDRTISGVNLLQAIARTNRPYPNKRWGQVVDYVGVGPELARSLAEYDREHLRQVYGYREPGLDHLRPDYRGEQPTADRLWLQVDAAADGLLRDLHEKVRSFLDDDRVRVGIDELSQEARREDLLAALSDPLLRGEFDELARDFLTALNAVLPRPQALPYESLARLLGEVQYLARHRYADGRESFSPRRYGAKVRQLLARHLAAGRIIERVPSVEVSDPEFLAQVNRNPDPRARVAYMSSRLRLRIDARLGSDRRRYERFSARLQETVRQMDEDFEEAAAELAELVREVREAEKGDSAGVGLDPYTEAPVYRLLTEALAEGSISVSDGVDLHQASRQLCVELAEHVGLPHFRHLPAARDRLRREMRQQLETLLTLDWEATGELAGELVELANARPVEFLRHKAR